jgi:hypothetical protein
VDQLVEKLSAEQKTKVSEALVLLTEAAQEIDQ